MSKYLHMITILLIPILMVSFTGCETMKQHKIASGATIGAAVGALGGAAVAGHKNRGTGALIGAAAGAALGGGVGYYLDRQEKKLKEIPDVEVNRVPEAPAPAYTEGPAPTPVPAHLDVRISNEILFDKASSSLKSQGITKMAEVADVLKQYPESTVVVQGYTSSEGGDATNLALSQRRAEVVRNQLVANGIDPARVTAVGMGSSNPLASNTTESGRIQNRRVEIQIIPKPSAAQAQ
jgi:outer membrane protein OmpA-like peptidoglycan-associated protein